MKNFKNYIETIKKDGIKKGYIEFTYYTKGSNNNWFCDYYYYDYHDFLEGSVSSKGYGYDKQSSSLAKALNLFNEVYTFKKGIKWESETSSHCTLKNKTFYGIYKDKDISSGIGINAVINCLDTFKNVKIVSEYQGKYENSLKIEIDYLKGGLIDNDK